MHKPNFRKKNISDLFQFAFAIYSNTAISSVETLFGVTRKSDKSDPIEEFVQGKFSNEQKVKYWEVMKWNIHFIDWLAKENYWFETEKEDSYDETAAANFDKAIELLKLLLDIRNKWSHYKHDAPEVKNRELRKVLLVLYNYACMETTVKLPPSYAGERGFFKFIESNKGRVVLPIADGEAKKGDFTDELTLTGYIFIISLFLQKHETSLFLEALEQNALNFDQINKRRSFREENPGTKYPEHLRAERKYFLYARDIYTHFAIRGHRDTLANTEEFYHKEQAFAIMEYLKRCPQERLANSVAQNKQDSLGQSMDTGIEQVEEESSDRYLNAHKRVKIENETYALREKNKFFEWAVAFLHEEMQKLAIDSDDFWDWKWARHASASKIKEERQQFELKNPLEHLPRHRKMIWDLPEQEEYRLNDRQEENGFPFFFERDKLGNYNHTIFKLDDKKKQTSLVGKLGADMLCTVLENYFERFPLNETDNTNKQQIANKQKFFRQFFESVSSHIQQKSDTGKGNTAKNPVDADSIRKRIAFLRQENEKTALKIEAVEEKNQLNEFNPDCHHDKITFIAKTWNKMLTYGQTNNLAHAADYKNSLGGKNGYQEIIRQLALLATADTITRDEIRNDLLKLLQKLGNRSHTNYYQAINTQIKASGIMGNSGSPYPLKKNKNLNDFYLQALNYRQAMLDKFEKRLDVKFNVDDWCPNAEMRWMGLRDIRTPLASNQEQKSPKNPKTGIYNLDKHFYAAVGVKHLPFIKAGMPMNMEVSDNLRSRHNAIYPSPNGNCLLIENFYAFDGWEDLSRTDRGRLYRIRRQDCLLSHLAYHYTRLYEGDYKDRTLQSLDFQKDAINIPVSIKYKKKENVVVNISMYYRHYKQNRYRMIPRRTEKILRLLWEQELLLTPQIAFNALQLKAQDELNESERFAFLSTEDQKMRWWDKNEKAKRKLASIKESYLLIPTAPEDREPFYFSEILNGYELCRRAFVARILKTEGLCIKQLAMSPNVKGYISFLDITKKLFENNYLSKLEKIELNQLRNCALHGDVPTGDLLPIKEDLLQITRDSDKRFIDFFGKGMRLMNKLNEKLYDVSHSD